MNNPYVNYSFMTPNAIVDNLMHLLTPEENIVLLFMWRHIEGWYKKRATGKGRIAISVFSDGYFYTDKDGVTWHSGGTGLSESAVRNALSELERFGIAKRCQRPDGKFDVTNDGQQWELDLESVAIVALKAREQIKQAAQQERTSKARANRKPLMSDITPDVGHNHPPDVGHNHPPDVGHNPTNKIGKVVEKKEKTPVATQRKRNPLFDAIAVNIWCVALTDEAAVKGASKRIGMVAAKIKDRAQPEQIPDFVRWYKRVYPTAYIPRDPNKFFDHWILFEASNKPKTNTTPDDTETPAPDAVSFQERLQANLRYSQMMQGGNDGDAG